MALRRGLASAVGGPIHAVGDQLDYGGIDDLDAPVELPETAGKTAAAKSGRERAQVIQGGPEQIRADGRGANPAGMGKGVALGRGGAANGAQGTRMEVKLVAEIVEAEAMDDLGEEQTDDVAPVGETPGMVFGLMLLDDPGQTVGRNEIAELAKDGEFRRG